MVLVDTDVLCAFAKVEALPLLRALFGVETLKISPGVWGETLQSQGYEYFNRIADDFNQGKITLVLLTEEELQLAHQLSPTLGKGERELLAVAKTRHGILLSNEKRVLHYAQQLSVICYRMSTLLRALWQKQIVSRDAVEQLIHALEIRDRMHFSEITRRAILED